MGPVGIALLVIAIIAVVVIAAILIYNALKSPVDPLANQPGHDHTHGGAAGCTACQAAAAAIKAKVPMKCLVQFRPLDTWQGEYGFDWLRLGAGNGEKAGEDAYMKIVNGGVKATSVNAKGEIIVSSEFTHSVVPPSVSTEDYEAVKNEYSRLKTEIKSDPENIAEYFVPYINLFPDKFLKTLPKPDPKTPSPLPLSEAELKVLITVERNSDEPDKIELEYDEQDKKKLFDLTYSFADKAKGSGIKRLSKDTVKIKCIEELSSDVEIRVMAYPKGWKVKGDAQIVGKFIVCKNDKSNRREIKFIFVNVKTDVNKTGIPLTGSYDSVKAAGETNNLYHSLYQALWIPSIEVKKPVVSLVGHKDFITGGKYIDPATKKLMWGTEKFRSDIRDIFLSDPKNSKYKAGFFTVFSFNVPAMNGVIGVIQKIGIRNLILFGSRDSTTLNHEVLHGLHLRHTHKETDNLDNFVPISSTDVKHTFVKPKTDNVMSYNSQGLTVWHWQWELLKTKNL